MKIPNARTASRYLLRFLSTDKPETTQQNELILARSFFFGFLYYWIFEALQPLLGTEATDIAASSTVWACFALPVVVGIVQLLKPLPHRRDLHA